MRIISGKYKGRRYSGAIPDGTRPTTDNVRESIFNILNNYIDFEEQMVADICAGTGFMGFEALSRAAKKCFFFEKSKKAIELINKIALQFQIDNYEIISGDAQKKLMNFAKTNTGVKFNLIFFDPPYDSNLFNKSIEIIYRNDLLKKNGLFVVEQSLNTKIILPENYVLLTERIFGTTKFSIIRNFLNNEFS